MSDARDLKPCPDCRGSGKCPTCDGDGWTECECFECGDSHDKPCGECLTVGRRRDGSDGKCVQCEGTGKVPVTDADLEAAGQIVAPLLSGSNPGASSTGERRP